jgi:UDP-N-acetylglucosamine diphosphorylase/glucosamine-1-phosphate N-acetyltransferase
MQLIVFEDDQVSRLHPITLGRPAYAIGCGSYRLIDWLERLAAETGGTLRSVVRPHLAPIQQLDFPQIDHRKPATETPALLVNARLVPTVAAYRSLRKLIDAASTAAVYHNKQLAAALIAPHGPAPPADADVGHWSKYLQNSIQGKLPTHDARLPLFVYPHDIVRYNLEIIGDSLAYRLESGRFREVADGVFAAEGAKLGQYFVADTSKGPVLLDEHAEVGPHCFLRGPAYLGPKARVIEHSAIKDAVALGHTTKIGGEIEASIVEPYTNKQHHGFLGHSYLGSWINLGAGTSNSDLKNTYGTVKMDYRGEQVATGMQFVGCIMGDYAKTAINTGIFTGKTIGCCSMVYGFVTTNVPSFVNYARLFGQVTELPPEVMVATQQRMFGRRSVQQRQCDIDLIHAMYDLTRNERQLAGEPLAL